MAALWNKSSHTRRYQRYNSGWFFSCDGQHESLDECDCPYICLCYFRNRADVEQISWQTSPFSLQYIREHLCVQVHTHTHLPNYLFKLHLFIERQARMGTAWDLETQRIGFQSCLCPHKGSLWGCSRSLISHLSKDTLTSFEGVLRMKYSNLCSTASSVWHMGHSKNTIH